MSAFILLVHAVERELAEDEVTELTCHYCNEKYHFSKEDMQTLLIEDTH